MIQFQWKYARKQEEKKQHTTIDHIELWFLAAKDGDARLTGASDAQAPQAQLGVVGLHAHHQNVAQLGIGDGDQLRVGAVY